MYHTKTSPQSTMTSVCVCVVCVLLVDTVCVTVHSVHTHTSATSEPACDSVTVLCQCVIRTCVADSTQPVTLCPVMDYRPSAGEAGP